MDVHHSFNICKGFLYKWSPYIMAQRPATSNPVLSPPYIAPGVYMHPCCLLSAHTVIGYKHFWQNRQVGREVNNTATVTRQPRHYFSVATEGHMHTLHYILYLLVCFSIATIQQNLYLLHPCSCVHFMPCIKCVLSYLNKICRCKL